MLRLGYVILEYLLPMYDNPVIPKLPKQLIQFRQKYDRSEHMNAPECITPLSVKTTPWKGAKLRNNYFIINHSKLKTLAKRCNTLDKHVMKRYLPCFGAAKLGSVRCRR